MTHIAFRPALARPDLDPLAWNPPGSSFANVWPIVVGGRLVRGYFTGDWGERRGRHVFFKRRVDTQVKINGYRIETGEIVARLAECGWPVACVLKHRDVLIAVVEASDAKPVPPAEPRARLHAELEPHAVPAYTHVIDRMPGNGNDKLDEAAVRAWLDEQASAPA